jgi:PAS domain S-box-containing protein
MIGKPASMSSVSQRLWAHLRRGAPAYLVLVVALVPCGIVYQRAARNLHQRDAARFAKMAGRATDGVQEHFKVYEGNLRAVANFFSCSSEVTPDEWSRFVAGMDLTNRNPGLRSIGYAPLVRAEEREVFPGRMKQLLGTNLPIVSAATGAVSFPTVYLTQFGGAGDARFGWDAMGERKRLRALDRLMAGGQPVAAGGTVFLADPDPQPGFITYVPVHGRASNEGAPPLVGVVFSSFVPQRMLRSLAVTHVDPSTFLEVFYATDPRDAQWLGFIGAAERPRGARWSATNLAGLFGEQLAVHAHALPAFEAASEKHLPMITLGIGLVFSLLIFGIAWQQVNARSNAEGTSRRLASSEEELKATNRELERTIADQRIAENLLAHERDLLRALLDNSPDGIYFKDRESRFIRCGRSVVERLGRRESSEMTGRTDADFFTAEHAQAARRAEAEVIRSGQPLVGTVEQETFLDGRVLWVLTSRLPLRDKHGNVIGTIGISHDITSLKNAEMALEKEKDLLAVTLRSIADGVIATDVHGRVVLLNQVAGQLTGWSRAEAVGAPLNDVFRVRTAEAEGHETDLVRRAIAGGEPSVRGQSRVLIARDGIERSISESVAPIVDRDGHIIGAVLVFRDITAQIKLQAELLRANKLESVGGLAGGIAHDFNNILTVILGNLSLARMLDEDMPKQMNDVLAEAEKASLRARDLTQRLLTFAKGGAPIRKPLALGPLLCDCAKAVLQNTGVQYHFFIAADLWPVSADESQMAQVVHNLIQYARHAAAEHPRIDIHAVNQVFSGDPLSLLKPGRYIRISIRDHGAGMAPDQLNKIFDPYFSPRTQGQGLELASAYSIVRKHEGQIRVESVSGEGSVFHIYLPASAEAVTETATQVRRRAQRPGAGRILVMDDEASIRKVATLLLARAGYTPVTAADGAEAVALYRAARDRGEPFAAVIMDLTVPAGMGGAEAVKQLRLIDPDVKAIVSSGYSNDPVMANFREHGFLGVVPKPYDPVELAAVLGEVLAADGDAQPARA